MSPEERPTIDQKLALEDLLDLDLLRDFIAGFAGFSGLKIQLLNARGEVMMSHGETPRYCLLARGSDPMRNFCGEAVAELGWAPMKIREPALNKCRCGANYLAIALATDFEQVGRAILGPYRANGSAVPQNLAVENKNRSQLEHAFNKIPLRDEEHVSRVAAFMADMADIFLFLSAKRLLTSRVHLESIYRARDEIFREMEGQMRSPEDRAELERLKQIF